MTNFQILCLLICSGSMIVIFEIFRYMKFKKKLESKLKVKEFENRVSKLETYCFGFVDSKKSKKDQKKAKETRQKLDDKFFENMSLFTQDLICDNSKK